MKYCLLFSLAFTVNNGALLAQSMRTIRVKAGDDVAQAYSANGFYRLPQYAKAILYYNNGKVNVGGQFNYNILSANMQFIGDKGDTLELGGKEALDSVSLSGTSYIFNNGFYEVVCRVDSVVLSKKIVIKTETDNIGAYGMPNATASITNMRSYTNGTSVYSLTLNQDVVVTENISWFFSDKKGNLVKASKSNLLKLLSAEKQAKTESWLKENKTSFDKEADLKRLMGAIER